MVSALLNNLPIQLVCQLLVSGCSSISKNETSVEVKTPISPEDLPDHYFAFPKYRSAYRVHEKLSTWNEARERCMEEGGYLAIADTRKKIRDIRSLTDVRENWLHVGIYKSSDNDQWMRVDNDLPVITSIPWTYDDPTRTGSCAGISLLKNGLVDYPCNGKREYFVCEIPITGGKYINDDDTSVEEYETTTIIPLRNSTETISNETATQVDDEVSTTISPGRFPEGYVEFPEDKAAYKIFRQNVTWYEAFKRCAACDATYGSRLAIPDSYEKIEHINSIKIKRGYNWLHTGISRTGNPPQWKRADDQSTPLSFVPWAYEGDGDLWGNCTGIAINHLGLQSYNCNTDYGYFVCEIPFA